MLSSGLWHCNLIIVGRYFLFYVTWRRKLFSLKTTRCHRSYVTLIFDMKNIKTITCVGVNQIHWPSKSDQLGADGTRQWTWGFCERRCMTWLADRTSASQVGFQSVQWVCKLSGVWIYRTAQSFKTIFEYGEGAKAHRIQEKQVRRVTMTLHCNNAN